MKLEIKHHSFYLEPGPGPQYVHCEQLLYDTYRFGVRAAAPGIPPVAIELNRHEFRILIRCLQDLAPKDTLLQRLWGRLAWELWAGKWWLVQRTARVRERMCVWILNKLYRGRRRFISEKEVSRTKVSSSFKSPF